MVNVIFEKEYIMHGPSKAKLGFEIVRNMKTWDTNMEDYVKPKLKEIETKGQRIIATNFLEINNKHMEALCVFWYVTYE